MAGALQLIGNCLLQAVKTFSQIERQVVHSNHVMKRSDTECYDICTGLIYVAQGTNAQLVAVVIV